MASGGLEAPHHRRRQGGRQRPGERAPLRCAMQPLPARGVNLDTHGGGPGTMRRSSRAGPGRVPRGGTPRGRSLRLAAEPIQPAALCVCPRQVGDLVAPDPETRLDRPPVAAAARSCQVDGMLHGGKAWVDHTRSTLLQTMCTETATLRRDGHPRRGRRSAARCTRPTLRGCRGRLQGEGTRQREGAGAPRPRFLPLKPIRACVRP
jgi:hypothetical protein